MRFKGAKFYDIYAKPQIYAADILINSLKNYRQNYDDIYEIGAGSGVLTRLILSQLECKNLILNDLYESEFMSKFSTQIGDITQLKIKNKQDLIISSSVFQWINELENLSYNLKFSLKSGGILAFSTFIDGTLKELSSFTNQSLEYKNLAQLKAIFSKNFEILNAQERQIKLKFNNLKELLTHLKHTGVNNIKGEFKLTKSSFEALNSHFKNNFSLSYKFAILILKN
ncbi:MULTISPECIES: methyltransferase domain-containing protein [Campylobacter]|uniref:methyltransferase domain-containing protein n=1 Tax=Campylobacter TaxID=194 RepID=UPI000A336193|nr:methyltransferase domain-containing protein [Campylobacter sp. P0124]MCR8696822.1 hypothetical protein [Campylobacter sp. RM19073]